MESLHAQIETAYWLLTDFWHRRSADSKTLDLANFLDGAGLHADGSMGIKLAVQNVTLEEGGESPTTKVTFAPAQPVAIAQLPTGATARRVVAFEKPSVNRDCLGALMFPQRVGCRVRPGDMKTTSAIALFRFRTHVR